MQAISKINLSELAPQTSGVVSLATRSSKPLPPGMGHSLALMMAQAQAAKPNQKLPEGTPEMWLTQWEAIALKFGIETFRDALLKALGENEFLPDPASIRSYCEGMARTQRDLDDGRRAIREFDELRAACLGPDAPPYGERVSAQVSARDQRPARPEAHTYEEIQAFIAREVDKVRLDEVRANMESLIGPKPYDAKEQAA